MKFDQDISAQFIIGRYPQGPYRFIGPTIPAILSSFSADFTWIFVDLWYFDSTQFFFQGQAINTFFGFTEWIEGIYTINSGVQFQRLIEGPGGLNNTVHWGSDRYPGIVRMTMDWHTCDMIVTDTAALLATDGTNSIAEVWHQFGGLYVNGWTNSGIGANLQYRKTALREVQMIGIAHSPNPFNSLMGTLPAGYRPQSSQGIWAWTNNGSGQLLRISSNGQVVTFGDPTIAHDWWINGTFSLDL